MFEGYVPREFCREYVEVRGDSGQLVNFMATVLGYKPLMDDWIPVERYEAFRDVCARHGLHVEAESIFATVPRDRVPQQVIARGSITTTSAYGMPIDAVAPPAGWRSLGARIHVFLSRDADNLTHGMWYPLVIRDRVIWSPRADMLAYGRLLGYPPCCIAFFQKYNNWMKYSFLWEIRRRSTRFHPFCNPLTKDRTYSYIYHMPCSFGCTATIEKVAALRADIAAREPELVKLIDQHLRVPALVFRERKIYFFEGTLRGSRIDYTKWQYEGGEPGGNILDDALRRGDAVEVDGQRVLVKRGGETLAEVVCDARASWGLEVPFVVGFSPDAGGS